MSPRKVAGLMLLAAGVVIVMGIVTAETQYPAERDYSTALNEVSDLGATRPPGSVITHPAADIFNGTMFAGGLLTIVAATTLRRERRRALPYVMGAFGTCIFLVGVFPGNNAVIHPFVATATFVLGGASCIVSARTSEGPMAYLSTAMGVVALCTLVFAEPLAEILGIGGAERWIVYPVVLWMVGFGGYLLGSASATDAAITANDRALASAASGG